MRAIVDMSELDDLVSRSPPSPGMLTTKERVIYKVVLTGGPCAGKTTTLSRLRTFFENVGWKVYTVPETATILLGGNVKFVELSKQQQAKFQDNIVKTILQIEQTFFDLAQQDTRNCLVVCDRGAMDPSAFCTENEWQETMRNNNWDSFMLRDNRYDQIIHLVTAAKGAENFYQTGNNAVRSEGISEAIERDSKAAQAWIGHPYCDVIDNSTDFDNKVRRVIQVICKRLGKRLGVNVDDRLKVQSKKRKFLVKTIPPVEVFGPRYQDFHVQHTYLIKNDLKRQCRVRKRGQNDLYTYTITERMEIDGEKLDVFRQVTNREYETLLDQADPNYFAIIKTRRCFHWHGQYFQLDIFKEPSNAQCKDLYLLETYTTEMNDIKLPDFLEITAEVTDNSNYSMSRLSIKQ